MWRPKDWENPIPALKPIPDNFPSGSAYHHHLLFEAGADAILAVLKKEGKYIDASKYPYGFVLNDIHPIQKIKRDFRGWMIILPDEEITVVNGSKYPTAPEYTFPKD